MSEQFALFWETEITKNPNGSVTLTPTRPLSEMSCKRAALVLGMSVWQVSELFRLGFVKGYKPGAKRKRKDGRGSNARLRLCSESVLRYKQDREREAREWQAMQA